MSEPVPPWADVPPPAGVPAPEPARNETGMLVLRAAIGCTIVAGAIQAVLAHQWWSDWPNAFTAVGSLAALALIIWGPQPRLATKWAWFWLSLPLSLGWAVFAFVEPVLLVSGQPVARPVQRLTGGKAFVLAIIINVIGNAVMSPWARF